MKKIFESQSLVVVETLKGILDQASIPATIKNQQTAMLAGEVPFAEVFPELWVLHDDDERKAKELLACWNRDVPPRQGAWTCLACGERHEAAFSACWKCGKERGEVEPG